MDLVCSLYDPRFWKSFTKKWMDQAVSGCDCRLFRFFGLPLMDREVDTIAGAKLNAFCFEKFALKVGRVSDHATSAYSSPRVHYAMPRHGIARLGHRVQCPADEDRTEPAVEEPRDLAVGRHGTWRNSLDDSIDTLE